jgi:hypothetical protein
MKKKIPAGQHVCPIHLPSLPHPITLIGGHVPLGILGGVGQPSSVLSSPRHAPPADVCALPALAHAPPSIVRAPTICCSFNPTHSQFVLICAHLTSCALSLCPFALVCTCCCHPCCGCCCAYAHPHAGPWFVCLPCMCLLCL